MITVHSTINLAHQSVPNVIPVVQGDTGRSILFSLADFTTPTGATARYFVTKPSGLAVYNDAAIDGNTVLVDLTAQSLAEYGDCPGQVRISVGDTVVTSFEFILHVEPFRGIDAVESSTETNIFDQAMNNARETIDGMIEDAEQAIEDASETAEAYIAQAIDPTLTIEDKAADAKATGDAIRYGAYPFLTAGQLLSTHETTDNTPYNFRTVEHESTLEYGEIVGGTVAWNQLRADSYNSTNADGITTSYSDGQFSITNVSRTTNFNTGATYNIVAGTTTIAGHKYLCCGNSSKNLTGVCIIIPVAGMQTIPVNSLFVPPSSDLNMYLRITNAYDFVTTHPIGDVTKFTMNIIDLTQMLGTTLADYIYSLESATAGAGVTWLRKHFPKMFTYHAYNAGSLVSVEGLSHHVTMGKNFLPLTVAGIKAVNTYGRWNGNEYTINGITFTIHVDVNGSVTDITANGTATANANLYLLDKINSNEYPFAGMILSGGVSGSEYVRIELEVSPWTTYATSGTAERTIDPTVSQQGTNKIITFLRVSSGYTSNNSVFKPMIRPAYVSDATFMPYVSPRTYPLDATKTFRGIYKLDSANKLYADGDRYLPDGTVQRRYGVVDLGSLTWTKGSRNNFDTGYVFSSASIASTARANENIMCSKLTPLVPRVGTWENVPANFIELDPYKYIIASAEYPDAATFKTAMSGVYLVYELATPTTETADPYTNPQIIAPGGTEEYISTSVVPVGHESRYPDDLRAKLDALPWDLSMIAPIENGTTASQAYAVGKYFMHNNQFCKAKTAIASGATLTLNTNYEVTTVANELYSALH